MRELKRRLSVPIATFVFVSACLLRWGVDADSYSNLTAMFSVFGIFGGALVSVSDPIHRADEGRGGAGCLGWLLGFYIAVRLVDNLGGPSDTWFLFIPLSAAVAIQFSSYLRRKTLLSSPIFQVLVMLLSFAFYTIAFLEGGVRRTEILFQLFGLALLTAILQVGFAFLPKREATAPSLE